MRKMMLLLLSLLLLLPALGLATEEPVEADPTAEEALAEAPEEITEEEELTEEEIGVLPTPLQWRASITEALTAAGCEPDIPFADPPEDTGEIVSHRYDSRWNGGEIVVWQEDFGSDAWSGYGLIFTGSYTTQQELDQLSAEARSITLAAMSVTHPKLSEDKLATFLNTLCPDFGEVAKSSEYYERSARMGDLTYTVIGGGTWGFPTIQAAHLENLNAELRRQQGT